MPADNVKFSRTDVRDRERGAARRPTKLTLDAELLAEAKRLKIDVSAACERGLASAVAKERAACWLEENQDAIAASNAYVEKYGLPLSHRRKP